MESQYQDSEILDILDIVDVSLLDDHLKKKINETFSLKSLLVLLNLIKKRIINGKSQKIRYPVHKIYERENEDLQLMCEVFRTILFVIDNLEEEVLQTLTYLDNQVSQASNQFNSYSAMKIVKLLNEIITTCKSNKKEYNFRENISLDHVEQFLLNCVQNHSLIRIYVLSTVLPNYYANLLDKERQLDFLHTIFLHCKSTHNLDILCVALKYANKKSLMMEPASLLFLDNFWKYLESCITCNSYDVQKQSIFILKSLVQEFHYINSEIPYLKVNNSSPQISNKVWQEFFVLLDVSKEKQLHLVWPSLVLLKSLKHLNSLWQVCVYKKLLTHTQNQVVYFVASHILCENIFFPSLNKYFLSSINKNEYTDYSVKMFSELPNYWNNLNQDDLSLFVNDVLQIIWTPNAAWCFFTKIFSGKSTNAIPFSVIEPLYKVLTQLPHVYVRNGCISIFFNYVITNYNWKDNFDNDLKLLFLLKNQDNDIFKIALSKCVDTESLNIIVNKIEDGNLDVQTFDMVLKILKISGDSSVLDRVLNTTNRFNKNLLLVLYSDLYERFKESDVAEFILNEIYDLDTEYLEICLLIINKLIKSHDFMDRIYSRMMCILNDPHSYNRNAIFVALYVVVNSYKSNNAEKIMIKDIKSGIKYKLFSNGKTDDAIYILFLDLYFLTEDHLDVSFLDNILHNESDIVISKMFEYLSRFSFSEGCSVIIQFFIDVVNILPNFTKSRYFKTIVYNYINCIFSMTFLRSLIKSDMLNIIRLTTDSLLSLSETFPIIDYYLSVVIEKTIISAEVSSKLFHILIPVVTDLLLKGIVIKKEDRVEYYVCQEINERLESATENPNYVKIATRMSALETMLCIVNNNPEYADNFTSELVEKYRAFFNKRYFPDSQIHLQKLRILQALLTIYPFIKEQRNILINLIEESFCTEIHQPCVKQLMQWLLLSLLKGMDDDYFKLIKTKIDTASKTSPSSIVAFIVVLLHLTLLKGESYWFSTIEAFIPWSMGANFKLRVYSQAAIKKLFDEAKQRNFHDFLSKYSCFENSILSVIQASGCAFYDTLKSDGLMFTVFQPDREYSLETIYVDIPKFNAVTRTEWENILKYKFTKHSNIDVLNKSRIFATSTTTNIENNKKEKINEEYSEITHNIQRKITPLKLEKENEGDNKPSDFILIASLIDKSTNLGGLSRTCEVFGVKQMVLNDLNTLKDKEFKNLSMSSEDWVDTVEVKTHLLTEYILDIRNRGYTVVGAEQTSESVCLHTYKFNKKTALVLGNEKEGIPPNLIPLLDACIEIPQFGMVRSLNVHVAGATFIWEYAKQHLVQ